MSSKKSSLIFNKIIALCILIVFALATAILASDTGMNIIEPEDNQYFELRAVKIKDVEGQNKQVIMELWGNNIEFKRI